MPELPEQKQSIRPPRALVFVALAALVVLAAVWFAVSTAVGNGGDDCAARQESGVAGDRCR